MVSDTDAYRVVHGEGDLLPALIVDRYGDYLVVQTLDQGMDRAKPEIAAALAELFSPRGIVERNDVAVRKREDLPPVSGLLAGEVPELVAIRMNGLVLHADLLRGQKTGIFLDQRENYLAAARYAQRPGAGLLHLDRRIRAAPGGPVRVGRGRGQLGAGAGGGRAEPRRQRDPERPVP